ncbi:unnamed protein product [Linum trigynum]|uniref:Uncharacterized protein n=1 Tax=Linum trigynum TaxID=586398 RepID=A0AAV2FQ49_9ROSI
MLHRARFVLKNWLLHSDSSCLSGRVNPCTLLSCLRLFSSDPTAPVPFAVSYLINECGVRPESAASAGKYIHFETPERADVVLGFFRNLGFTDSQLPKVFGRHPRLLMSDPEKHFIPRIRFLESNGFSTSDIALILLRTPEILHASIENQLLPNLNFFKTVMPSDENLIRAIRRSPFLLTCELETYVIPGIRILRESGVGESSIVRLLLFHPRTLMTSRSQLSQAIERVKKMGVDPRLRQFSVAVQTIRGVSKGTWDSKIDAYKKWGWSNERILKAFTKSPWCMAMSVKKLMANMDYYVNKMGFDPLVIAARPVLLAFSLDKRIMPRDAVLCVLLSKGLIESRASVQALALTNEGFQKKFLDPYKEQAPELLQLFQEKLRTC